MDTGKRMNRMLAIAVMFSLLLLGCLGRIAWLQLAPGGNMARPVNVPAKDGWKRYAVTQRQRQLVLDTGRGDFLDRYGNPITGETYDALALFPVVPSIRGNGTALRELGEVLHAEPEAIARFWDGLREPKFWPETGSDKPMQLQREQVQAIKRLQLEGARVLAYRNRYISAFAAKHFIGFTSQHPEWVTARFSKELVSGKHHLAEQVGGTGLEKSLDSYLHGIGPVSVSYFIDGCNKPLNGLDLRLIAPRNPYYPLQVVTTIDLELQNKLEAYAMHSGLKEGAIVVLDAASGDVAAMVSIPELHPDRFATSDGSEWSNYALKAVEPGSIFKLVTAAAALEAGVAKSGEHFHCSGEYGKYRLSCWKKEGHGDITLAEGLAHSCNIVFATLAERLQPAQLERMAEKLGMEGRIGWHSDKRSGKGVRQLRLLEEEEPGRVFPSSASGMVRDGGVMAQTGIGQRDVRISPLQAANLIVTLLHGGEVMEPRLVSEIRYANGQSMVRFPRHAVKGNGRIGRETASWLIRRMEEVVDRGTGMAIRSGRWKLAGKSGTAETTKAGAARNHQWFAGFGPVESPRYAVAVLAAYRAPGSSHLATRIFREVMDIAASHEEASRSLMSERSIRR
ncbi:penicillin-binding transpeptidase domain-containing protein [Paenibacillus sp. J5C_2022]|uniref:peptidoglycan D,D-transpeptidase FtsI family protein n=1 Tax=Paenibacillus sp. J5C2022 TaxID=2977129 RepID=UPI0021D2DB67|nr:penicillin-binding transpeptidase domain-containing protein [Paenibacillus sp. J5C2022]MCU6709645.1 penicillin-binding transpeptidase domain-containing protein [Paenibacillus sp. J5C2022]